jgi:hypothetical protein
MSLVNKHNVAVLATCFHAGLLFGLFPILKLDAIYSSKESFDFQRTAQRYIPEGSVQTQCFQTYDACESS